jgi:hypothetical protein
MAALRDGYGLFQGFRTTRTKQPSQRQPVYNVLFPGLKPPPKWSVSRCRPGSANRIGNCPHAPGARQEHVPSACARPAVGTTSTAPGGRASSKGQVPANTKTYDESANQSFTDGLRTLWLGKTHTGSSKCTQYCRLCTLVFAFFSGRIRNTTRLAATCANLIHASARSASGAKRAQVGRSARQLRTALAAANAHRTGRASCSKRCTLCGRAGHRQRSGSWRVSRVRQVQCEECLSA